MPRVFQQPANAICVVGMHRSGTSMVTRLLHLGGINLGPPEHFIPPQEDNQEGFWENRHVIAINDRLLAILGGSWRQPPAWPTHWDELPGVASLQREACELLASIREHDPGKPWGWKDPRTTLTIPFWRRAAGRLRFVLVVRNPIDVARSLEKPHGISRQEGYRLWLQYMQVAIRNTMGDPTIVTFYDEYFDDRTSEVDRLFEFCGLDVSFNEPVITDSVRPDLRHHVTDFRALVTDTHVPFPVKVLYAALRIVDELGWSSLQWTEDSKTTRTSALEQMFEIHVERVQSLEGQLRRERERLTQIDTSAAWAVVRAVRRAKDALLPSGSVHRRVYDTLLRYCKRVLRRPQNAFDADEVVDCEGAVSTGRSSNALTRSSGRDAIDPCHEASWVKRNTATQEELARWRDEVRTFPYRPVISVLMPVFQVEPRWLVLAIESVRRQIYPHWDLCIVDDGSSDPSSWEVIQRYMKQDSRITAERLSKNEGISMATNTALRMASGEFLALLDHDDELTPDAFYHVVKLLNRCPEADIIYSDEDKVTADGVRCEPFFKPDWSPDFFLSCMYTCHLGVYRKRLVEKIGGFRKGYEGSQDYDLVLRLIEGTQQVHHIPRILYHWRILPGSAAAEATAKPGAHDAGKRALQDYLRRNNIDGEVLDGKTVWQYRVKRTVVGRLRVSIIIPMRDRLHLTQCCIQSIRRNTSYDSYEVVIIDNGSVEEPTKQWLAELQRCSNVRVLSYPAAFNFSDMNNAAVQRANGDCVLFLNNDTEVVSNEWLVALLEHCQRKEVGAVGAKLLYQDQRIQHAGVVLGVEGVAAHVMRGMAQDAQSAFGPTDVIRNYSAVTAACMMVRRDVFEEVSGFNAVDLRAAFGDTDLCLRLRQRGYRIVYTPYAVLNHHESSTRGPTAREEIDYMENTWADVLARDPFYNPHLSRETTDCRPL